MKYKICTKCGESKPATLEFFYRHKTCRGGLNSQCKDCKKEKDKKWRENNPEKEKARHKKWRENNPDKVKICRAEYRENNPDKVKISRAEWRSKNHKKVLEYGRRQRTILADSFVVDKIHRQFGIPRSEIDSVTVEAKRRELKYYRIYKQLTKDSK